MLSALPRPQTEQRILRFANVANLAQFAAQKNLSLEDISDVISFQRESILQELLAAPFTPKAFLAGKFGWPTRYSNGDWPVFYGALARETAEREVAYHYGRLADPISGTYPVVRYTLVWCSFRSTAIDLRPQLGIWPDLVSDDYAFCNLLGREANETGLGGFLAPSARHSGGTTVPVFLQDALAEPEIDGVVQFPSGP